MKTRFEANTDSSLIFRYALVSFRWHILPLFSDGYALGVVYDESWEQFLHEIKKTVIRILLLLCIGQLPTRIYIHLASMSFTFALNPAQKWMISLVVKLGLDFSREHSNLSKVLLSTHLSICRFLPA